jgi:hypothetical protein
MVFPDLFKEQTSGAFGIDGGMCRDEVHMLDYTVNNIHNCVIPMGFRQFDYEVNADHIPWYLRCLQRVELTNRSSMLQFYLVAQTTGLDIDADVAGHLGPPVVVGYKL